MKKSLFVLSVLCFSATLMAQEYLEYPAYTSSQASPEESKGAHPYRVEQNEDAVPVFSHWSLIPQIGFNIFDGDFNSEMSHSISYPNGGIAVEYSFTPAWNLGIDYMFDRYCVTGKPGGRNADVLLNGYMHQVGGYLSLDLISLFFPRAKKKIVGIQPLIGVGHAWYRNTVMYDDDARGNTANSEPSKMSSYSGAFFIRAGVNVEFNLNRTLALGIRGQYNYFVNDYIDGRGFRGIRAIASKNNDGIFDITLNMRIKFEAVPETHVRNVIGFDTWKKEEKQTPQYVHDTVIIKHDSIIVRETFRQTTKEQKRIYYVYFDNNKSNLNDEALVTIQQVADILEEDSTLYAVVTGYCDNTGSASLNYALGDKRADNVLDELVAEHAVDTARLYAMGMGKLVGRRSQAAYGPNRRAAIRLVDKATFERMKGNLQESKEHRIIEEPAVKTVPLEESARPEKVNVYKQRLSEEVVVDKSTTLSKLARKYYNNTYCWVYIYIANKEKIANPNALVAGTKLTIPELTQKEMQITKDESLVLFSNARQGK